MKRLYSEASWDGGTVIGGLLLAIMSWLGQLTTGVVDHQATVCPAIGTARIDPMGAVAGSRVTVVVTVDSPEARCRAIVKNEPFLILESGSGSQEAALVPDNSRYRAEVQVPAEPWAIHLYVNGNPDPVLTLAPDRQVVDSSPADSNLVARTPGAFIIVGTAVALAALALLGLPAIPRGRVRPSR